MSNIQLDQISIASPCKMDWNAMQGDEKARFCGDCRLNVYNLSGMTKEEAETLVKQKEGRLCVRFYRRADGRVLTQDCPVGLAAKLRARARRMWWAMASLLAAMAAGVGYARWRTGLPRMPGAYLGEVCPTPTMGQPVSK